MLWYIRVVYIRVCLFRSLTCTYREIKGKIFKICGVTGRCGHGETLEDTPESVSFPNRKRLKD
jgi:hypothetical protein